MLSGIPCTGILLAVQAFPSVSFELSLGMNCTLIGCCELAC